MFDENDAKYFDPTKDLNFDENIDQFPIHYDLEEVFDDKIYPLLKTIVNLCSEYDIPMLTSFQYKHNGKQTMLCTSVVLPKERTGIRIQTAAKTLLE